MPEICRSCQFFTPHETNLDREGWCAINGSYYLPTGHCPAFQTDDRDQLKLEFPTDKEVK